MLKGIPAIIGPELLRALDEMGHGDTLVLADANFPAESVGRDTLVVRCDGHGVPELLEAVLRLVPLDQYVEKPVTLMEKVPGDTVETPVWDVYDRIVAAADGRGAEAVGRIDRFPFYEAASRAYVVVATGERAQYANVIVQKGVGDTTFSNVLELSRHAARSGADAVLAVSPYYFGPSPQCAERYFGAIAEAQDLPVVLYNFPARTGTDLTPDLVASLAARHPAICGIKDTVDCISHTREVIGAVRAVNPEFSVLSGFDEYYLANRSSGGNGVLCGLTNAVPEVFSRMDKAYKAGDLAEAFACSQKISRYMAVYGCADLFVSAVKGAVAVEGLPISTRIFDPAVQLDDAQMERIASILGVSR